MSARILIAGLGNTFQGDAGFGVEAARRLARDPLPAGVSVSDVGIRSLHLAYAMLDRPDLLLAVDAARRGRPPGTVYLMDVSDETGGPPRQIAEAHGMSIDTVVTAFWTLGGKRPPVLLIGCEPSFIGERTGLSPVVKRGLPKAVALIRATADRWLRSAAGQPIGGIAKSSQDGVWFPSVDG
ncbi:MAG TPA: hydrogenase maturation protease [Polyangia bacterium]|jgi:hydrogenase maturation protease